MSLETILGDTLTGPSLLSIPRSPPAPPAHGEALRLPQRDAAAVHAQRPGRPQLRAPRGTIRGRGAARGMMKVDWGATPGARR
ncbi:hypothetical protein BV87_12880 [Sphingobium yanoikuyae]|uniref:Uncharacterized protein n=2 Tax=Sphingomonadaceae TaxID=41297 RepID=A0A2D1R2W7_SPHYA|nr:hypothetical protein BV87_12880 [Sphingobium yanoikuyae]